MDEHVSASNVSATQVVSAILQTPRIALAHELFSGCAQWLFHMCNPAVAPSVVETALQQMATCLGPWGSMDHQSGSFCRPAPLYRHLPS